MLREKITEHADWVAKILHTHPNITKSEAGTKTSLIEPFLRCLGYNTSHPEQVALEVATELGGKIDYVLSGQANTKIAVEAKRAGITLSEKEINQLRSYFTFSEAVAGILTNGVDYWLFTDLEKTNVMDADPYRRVDVRNLTDSDIRHLASLTRSSVNQAAIHEHAQRERYRTIVTEVVTQELHSPSQDFLRLIGKRAEIKPLTKANLAFLQPLVQEALSHHLGQPHPRENDDAISPPHPAPPPVNTPPLTAGQKAAQTLKGFQGARLFGKRLSVANYTQLLTEVAKALLALHPHIFAEVVQQKPFFKPDRKWQWVSKDRIDLYPDTPTRKVGHFYFDVGMSAKDKEKRARLLLERLGHDPDMDMEIQTSKQ